MSGIHTGAMQIFSSYLAYFRDKMLVYDEHPIAGRDIQPLNEINKEMCNM